jgi:hypothetical protein
MIFILRLSAFSYELSANMYVSISKNLAMHLYKCNIDAESGFAWQRRQPAIASRHVRHRLRLRQWTPDTIDIVLFKELN